MGIFTIATSWEVLVSVFFYGIALMLACFFYILFMDWWNFTDELAMKARLRKEKIKKQMTVETQKLLVDNDE